MILTLWLTPVLRLPFLIDEHQYYPLVAVMDLLFYPGWAHQTAGGSPSQALGGQGRVAKTRLGNTWSSVQPKQGWCGTDAWKRWNGDPVLLLCLQELFLSIQKNTCISIFCSSPLTSFNEKHTPLSLDHFALLATSFTIAPAPWEGCSGCPDTLAQDQKNVLNLVSESMKR